MKKPFFNIGFLLLVVIIVPPLFFTSYELGTFYQNEEMIDSIYTSQLESVLFSVNQYSDDILSGWANRLEQNMQMPDALHDFVISEFVANNISVTQLFLTDSSGVGRIYHQSPDSENKEKDVSFFQLVLDENELLIQRLDQYLSGGYRKIQTVDAKLPNHNLLLFAFARNDGNTGICGIVLDQAVFVKENLGPKIQAIAQDRFYLSVFDTLSGEEVYSNELYPDENRNIQYRESLWLIPDYQLGIRLKGETIDDIVAQRTRFNIWLIVIVDLLMILAAFFVYHAVRQQMKLAQLKSEFVSNVSHEIRTPLAVINMYSETLEMNGIKDEEKKQSYYHIINTEANRLSGIVNKILNFSKIEKGKREYTFVSADLNNIIQQIIDTYQHHFQSKGFSCQFNPAAELPQVSVDNEAITDALINLIDNAIKYSVDKKQIVISTGVKDKYVFVEVKDYGLGIEEKYQKMVFDKFYRVTKGNLAHQAKGSGIGLSIVKHIMLAHKGSVTLISKIGEGSRFILNFPRYKA